MSLTATTLATMAALCYPAAPAVQQMVEVSSISSDGWNDLCRYSGLQREDWGGGWLLVRDLALSTPQPSPNSTHSGQLWVDRTRALRALRDLAENGDASAPAKAQDEDGIAWAHAEAIEDEHVPGSGHSSR